MILINQVYQDLLRLNLIKKKNIEVISERTRNAKVRVLREKKDFWPQIARWQVGGVIF